jgi:hypothetical protein
MWYTLKQKEIVLKSFKKFFDQVHACCALGSAKTLMAARLLNEKG